MKKWLCPRCAVLRKRKKKSNIAKQLTGFLLIFFKLQVGNKPIISGSFSYSVQKLLKKKCTKPTILS